MTNKQKAVLILIVCAVITLGYTFYNANTVEYTPIETVEEEKDSIQKLTDNVATTYRELKRAEQAHASTTQQLEQALEDYNSAIEYLNTFTR